MGIRTWWSRVRTEIHTLELESDTTSRLAHTPPEFWAPKDWSESRRLRNRRRVFMDDEIRRGMTREEATTAADKKFPRGPFWPHTPERDMGLRYVWLGHRSWQAMLSYAEFLPDEEDLFRAFYDEDTGRVTNPRTGVVYDLGFFGM